MPVRGLDRFVEAQAPVIARVMAELATGRKETHWMWFVFPQVRRLGRSEMALRFGIEDQTEARDYARHPLLGARLRAAAELVLSHSGQLSARTIMGDVDAMKLRSSMTLFAHVAADARVFDDVLEAFFEGQRCVPTVEVLR